MPTTLVEYNFKKVSDRLLDQLAEELPSIIAPKMNITGRELHDGGVGEAEVIVRFVQFSPHDRNTNDLQITTRAHCFEERVERVEDIERTIRSDVKTLLDAFGFDGTAGIEVYLAPMGYGTINKEG